MNKAILMGRLTKDVELKYSNGNVAFTSFTVAVNREFTKEGEERQADFIICKAFGKTAEFVSKYFNKGRMINLVGRIQTGSYEKDGSKVFTTDVIVEKVYFCGDGSKSTNPQDVAPNQGFVPITNEVLPF
jgi:single-strand DNA-binding protein